MSEINDAVGTAIEIVRCREYDPIEYERAARLLADIVERAVEWFADVDLVYPSQTEQAIRNALHEILEGPDE